jgi:predicted nucleotidyltransferase
MGYNAVKGTSMHDRTLQGIAGKHGLRLLIQFGSTVSGTLHAQSDVDLAALLNRSSLSLQEYAELLDDLQSLYSDRKVDLVVINCADPLLLKKITDTCRLLYGPVRQFEELKIYAFKRYHDHRKYFELEREFVSRLLDSAPTP